jgi:hypothetical protein
LPLSSRCSLGALSSRTASFSSVTFLPLCQPWALSLMSSRAKVNCHGLCATRVVQEQSCTCHRQLVDC